MDLEAIRFRAYLNFAETDATKGGKARALYPEEKFLTTFHT